MEQQSSQQQLYLSVINSLAFDLSVYVQVISDYMKTSKRSETIYSNHPVKLGDVSHQ